MLYVCMFMYVCICLRRYIKNEIIHGDETEASPVPLGMYKCMHVCKIFCMYVIMHVCLWLYACMCAHTAEHRRYASMCTHAPFMHVLICRFEECFYFCCPLSFLVTSDPDCARKNDQSLTIAGKIVSTRSVSAV